ncbi:lipopolysaccharide biosynthesis protein [Pontibacter chinhatensis]|uniref:Membrane protein involved in the export of O-antigen and teichoic acid n=1 Tax=Pontibacter chinhatensis TaxID=1436961 RepID=A0A1I2R1A0_9BACT|nr:lipopolysaccharide biosynthesis protein [Pontibacter chinhatensis]SFG33259.1 Membrane protein involved in the export of O-antigen and teichoic acid [Pontibacter chinhatensis]
MNTKTLKGKVVNGVFWNAVQLIINRGFDFIIKLVLAKLLFPEQFGLVGMAAVFTSFVQVFNELGMGAALVQRKEEDLREEHFQTTFWTGVIWSSALYLIIVFVVSPLAAGFYKEPMLKQIIPVLSLGVLSSPINIVHKAQLTKAMNFKKLAFIGNASKLFSGTISLGLAFYGAGVWSLVFSSVASFLVAMPMYFRATGWKPKMIWDKQAFYEIFGFGVYTTGTNVFNNLTSKIDYLLIGKLMSASALGSYTLAFVLTDTFRSQLMSLMNQVMYPVYGQKQNDPVSLKRYYLNVVKYNSLIIYPIMVSLFVLGEPFILSFFGEKWVDTIEPLRILSLSVMVHMMVNSNTSLIRGLGKPGLEMRIQLFKTLLLYVPSISLGIYWYGVVGAAYAILFNKIISVFIAQYFLKKLLGLSFIELFQELKVPLIASLTSFIVVYLLNSYGINFIICAMIQFVVYVLVTWLMMGDELIAQVKSVGLLKLNK